MRSSRHPAPTGVRFLHTADLQLGMPFRQIPGDAGAKLRERRLDTIGRLDEAASSHGADFIVVAGDFFDSNDAPEQLVQQVLSRMRQAKVPFLVLPGNHDHAGTGSIYARPSLRKSRPENLRILDHRDPVSMLDGRVKILPAPLRRRRELDDPTAHITPELGADETRRAIRIGVAHGSMLDIARDVDGRAPNLIAKDRAERAGLDYLALGDWHGMTHVTDRSWYSGTPEPTSFKQNNPGHALLVDIEAPGAVPNVTPIPVATTRWIVHTETVQSGEDVRRLQTWFEQLGAPQDLLVDLTVEGVLPLAEKEALDQLLARMSHQLLHFTHESRVYAQLADHDLAMVAVDGAVRAAIDRLRSLAASSSPQARAAQHGLLTLYRLAMAEGGSSC
jgi:DNA repair exonuclease SbcCD nuclease subunit